MVTEFNGEIKSYPMAFVFSSCDNSVYEVTLNMPNNTGLLFYYFDIGKNGHSVFYGNNDEALGGIGKLYDNIPDKKYQITVYDENFTTPSWWKSSICYQIFPDRFAKSEDSDENLSKRQDIIKRNWGDDPFYKPEQFGGKYLSNDFFGGTLKGVEDKLPYLKDLGISCIYLNPIFKAYSNHRYDTGDYKTIDPILGDEKDFTRLCKTADGLGIRIILDGVFNHTGSDSLYFNKNGTYSSVGAYQSKESPYFNWFRFSEFPDKYESWWGIDTLPQVEENCVDFQEYILTDKDSVVKHWLKKGASGWRLDVVDELPDFFVKILRAEVKKQDPDAVIIGEVWEDASHKVAYDELREYFLGEELDSVMNYPLRSALIDYVTGNINAECFERRVMSLKENYPAPAFYSLFNFLSSHDTERILTILGGKNYSNKDEQCASRLSFEEKELAKRKLKCIITLQMLLPGVPVIFYGDEAGIEGFRDPFCRRCFPWGLEDKEITDYYKKAIATRCGSDAFSSGEFEPIYNYRQGFGFIRYNDKDSYIVLVNTGEFSTFRIDLARFGITELENVDDKCQNIANDGIFYIDMPEYSAKVFKKHIN
ncbi:MAG: glycoside hydrolase family 13 protein [Clostridia bacterium]|nr:glycoside hydrolase family 13 protein [Clostridia bacterium]